jgi:peptide/nickel transport system ATP-binding protein
LNEVLNIKNLSFGYSKEKLIYENFNLSLHKGEVIAIVGQSGCGKTTLFELICNNLTPLKGEIKALKTSSIYQDPYSSFHPTYSIMEQIQDVVDSIKELDELTEELSLQKELLYKRPHELSGGQLQRCSILRSLLMKPELLLVDEPTSALDNVIALEVMQLLMKFLHKCGILLITHDMALASWCSKTIINLNDR